jgi:hypothetical protein
VCGFNKGGEMDKIDLKELKRVLELCREHGVLRFKGPSLELELSEATQHSLGLDQALKTPVESITAGLPMLNGQQLTEDDLINWSSGS